MRDEPGAAGAAEEGAPTRDDARSSAPAGTAVPDGGVLRRVLGVPLFHKMLFGNVTVVVAFALAMDVLADAAARPHAPLLLAAAAVLLTVVVNATILRWALRPLALLQETAQLARAGHRDARVPVSPLADRAMRRLTETFNGLLDADAAHRARLRKVAITALGAAEEERRRLARELHDGTAQELAAVLLQLKVARRLDDTAARDALLEQLGESLGRTVDEIRGMAGTLRPPSLDMLGLAPALETIARQLGERTTLRIRTRLDNVSGALAPEAELALYRVVQEALTNAVRHASAQEVELDLVRRNGAVVATVRDDGRGFGLDSVLNAGAVGLFGMQERAAYVGGSVAIRTEPGAGTRVEVVIPVREATPQ
jgi:two-component system, NarL family, sensor histidine kinase UhpB